MEQGKLLKRVKSDLKAAFGKRLRGVVLYGSEVRGQAQSDSDIDLLVLLDGPVDFGRDLRTGIHALYSLVLEIGRPIDVRPVDVRTYEAQEFPLYRNAMNEGILA